jgi:hypothetical protein
MDDPDKGKRPNDQPIWMEEKYWDDDDDDGLFQP